MNKLKRKVILIAGLTVFLTACSQASMQKGASESSFATLAEASGKDSCCGGADCKHEPETTAQGVQGSKEGGSLETKDEHYPVTVTNYNFAGNEVTLTFEKAPERVIAIDQGQIETMIALGLEDHVIASYCLDNEVKEEWKDGFSRMKYASDSVPDKETVVMLKPDLIFSWGSLFSDKMLGEVDYWLQNGTNTYMNSNTRPGGKRILENEYTDILNIGKIFNVEDKAEALVSQMKADIEMTKAKVGAEATTPTIAVVEFDDSGIRNYGWELAGDIAKHLGVNVMQSNERFMGKEDLVKADPDVIFVVYMPGLDENNDAIKEEQLAKLLKEASLASLSAVKNGKVHSIMLSEIYAPTVRAGDGIRTIANGLYPGIIK